MIRGEIKSKRGSIVEREKRCMCVRVLVVVPCAKEEI